MRAKPTVSIIGFGRFGQVLYKLLKDDFRVTLFQRHSIDSSLVGPKTRIAHNLKEVYTSEVIFFAVPIESFEEVIKSHRRFFRANHLLIDVLSVKMHPAKVLHQNLKGLKTRAILTHPMFGPDSSKDSFHDLPMVMHQFSAKKSELNFWTKFFAQKGLRIIKMSPLEHDSIAANSQALTHLIAKLLANFDIQSTRIDTLAFKKLLEVRDICSHDSLELFKNLQHFNPQTIQMRRKLKREFNKLFASLHE